MAQSVVDICNSALQRVGAKRISSINDNSPEARACLVAYDSNRRDEIRRYPWNFATKRVQLAPDSTAPAFGFTYQYTFPSDCLRVLRPNDPTNDWVIEGRKILSNDGPVLNVRYLADIDDTSQFDSNFYNVVAAALAVDLVEVLTQSNVKKQTLQKDYEDAVRAARRQDSIETGAKDAPDPSLWTVRY